MKLYVQRWMVVGSFVQLVTLFLVIFCNDIAFADEDKMTLTVNLAEKDLAVQVIPMYKGKNEVNINIENLIPSKLTDYSIEWSEKIQSIAPLSLPPVDKAASPLQSEKDTPPQFCNGLIKAYSELYRATSEKEVAIKKMLLKKALTDNIISDCDKMTPDIENLIKSTQKTFKITLRKGVNTTVKVTRPYVENNELKKYEWSKTFDTGIRGRWDTIYGFSFLVNRDKEYFSKSTNGEYVIKGKNTKDRFDFVPSIFFHWATPMDDLGNWAHGPIAGLGFDISDPVVFLGYGIRYNQNINFSVGGSMHKEKRLNSRYTEGETISDNLDSSQLAEEVYNSTWYFSLGLRFGSNPFNASKP